MSYSTYTNLTGADGLTYYNGYIYAGSYSNGTITKIDYSNSSIQTTYYSFSTPNDLSFMRVYDNYLYCTLRLSGKIVYFNLSNPTATPIDYVTFLILPKSFFIFDGYIYITLIDRINRYNTGDFSVSTIIDSTTQYLGVNVLDTPQGIDTDGGKIYFCNYGTNSNVYYCEFDGTGIGILSTLPQGTNDGLVLYGQNVFVASNSAQKVYQINTATLVTTIFQTFTENPNLILFINNSFYVSSISSNKILIRPFSTIFNTNFTLSYSSGLFTYTLNNNFTINNNWEEVGFLTDKVILNGDSKTITITGLNTDSLFFGGGNSNTNRLEINNLYINSSSSILSGLLRANGYSKINNCHLEITGNINSFGGGLVYNNIQNTTYVVGTDIQMDISSVLVNGKIGEFAGPLMGFFIAGCNAVITNSFSVILDNSPELVNNTIDQNAGAFVGGSVGLNYNVSISNSYCVFSGSMKYGSGIIGGKYLGSNGNLIIDKFYAVTNITSVVAPSIPSDYSQYSYFISSYAGGSLPSITATNVNFLNFNINSLYLYADVSTQYSSVSGVNKYTSYSSFEPVANTSSARVGTQTYYLNYKNGGVISSYLMYSPTNNITYELLIGSSNNTLLDRTITFSSIPTKTYGDSSFNLGVSVTPTTTLYYSSSDSSVASVNSSGVVTINTAGTSLLTAYTPCDETYTYVQSQQTLTINKANPTIFMSSIQKSVGDSNFTPTVITDSSGSLIFTSSNSSVASIISNQIKINRKGRSTITVNQSSDINYNSGTTTALLTVSGGENRIFSAEQTLQISFQKKTSWKGYLYYQRKSNQFGYPRLYYSFYRKKYLLSKIQLP